jgi:hypothetical protein
VNIWEAAAERRIEQALARGELTGLPGEGRPVDLDDARDVPEELRMAYRVLRNAGVTPEQVGLRRELADLRARIGGCEDARERVRLMRRHDLLNARLRTRPGYAATLAI